MPVFHTKTIESILDPVAQQVSFLLRGILNQLMVILATLSNHNITFHSVGIYIDLFLNK